MKDRVKETGQEALEHCKEIAQETTEAVRQTAQESVERHAEEWREDARVKPDEAGSSISEAAPAAT